MGSKRPVLNELDFFTGPRRLATLADWTLPERHRDARRSWPRWSSTALLDDLIRLQQDRLRDRQPERLGGLEVDDQLELLWLLDGEVAGLGTF
jgi:hypothetical protein